MKERKIEIDKESSGRSYKENKRNIKFINTLEKEEAQKEINRIVRNNRKDVKMDMSFK